MPEELFSRSFAVRGRDFEKAGEASTEIKTLLKELEIDPQVIRRVVVVAFEAEMNVVMYAEEGTVSFVLTDDDIGIEVADRGPGIPDLELALQEGWSTATDEMREMGFGFGMGLPNIRRNADACEITSEVGRGTTIACRIKLDGDA
jgi:anti-sigma regulatory factor (Ser/Thr protein kinase)